MTSVSGWFATPHQLFRALEASNRARMPGHARSSWAGMGRGEVTPAVLQQLFTAPAYLCKQPAALPTTQQSAGSECDTSARCSSARAVRSLQELVVRKQNHPASRSRPCKPAQSTHHAVPPDRPPAPPRSILQVKIGAVDLQQQPRPAALAARRVLPLLLPPPLPCRRTLLSSPLAAYAAARCMDPAALYCMGAATLLTNLAIPPLATLQGPPSYSAPS